MRFGHFASDGGKSFIDDLYKILFSGLGRVDCRTDPCVCLLSQILPGFPFVLIERGDRYG